MSLRWCSLLSLWAALAGCTATPSDVAFRVAVVGDDPFLGADTLALRVERADGTLIAEELYPPDTRAFVLSPLPFETPLSLRVETRVGTLPLAGGRSFLFEVPGPASPPSRGPDVTLGLLGRHALVGALPTSAEIRALAATDEGALLATRDALIRFVAHGDDGRAALLDPIALPLSRVGATFTPLAGGMLAVGGAEAGATLFASDGTIVDTVFVDVLGGAALATLEAGALIAGGRDGGGAERTEVLLVAFSEARGLEPQVLEPLPAPRSEARALALHAMSSAGPVPRVLVVDGTSGGAPADDFLVIDPEGMAGTTSWTPPRVLRGAALTPLETGQVLAAGGRDPTDAVVDEVRVLFVHAERPMDFLSPEPDRLFRAREGATALTFAPGVALVLGGRDPMGLSIDATELADLRILPGSVRLTGSLPRPSVATQAVRLGDTSILVVSGDAVSLYFPYPL